MRTIHPLTWDLFRRGDHIRRKRFHGAIVVRETLVFLRA